MHITMTSPRNAANANLGNNKSKKLLYNFLRSASSDALEQFIQADGLWHLADYLKQEDRKAQLSTSNIYAATHLLSLYFWPTHQSSVLEVLLHIDVTAPKARSITFLQRIQYNSLLDAVAHKVMYIFQQDEADMPKCIASASLLNALLHAKKELLQTYSVRTFSVRMRQANQILNAWLPSSNYGNIKRFFKKQQSLKEQLEHTISLIPDVKREIQEEHIAALNESRSSQPGTVKIA